MIPPKMFPVMESPHGEETSPDTATPCGLSAHFPDHSQSNVCVMQSAIEFEEPLVRDRRIARSLARLTSNEN